MTDLTALLARLERLERIVIMSSKEVLNAEEVALMLGVSKSRVYHMICANELPYYRKGQRVSFRKSEIEAHMLGQRIATNDELQQQAARLTININKK